MRVLLIGLLLASAYWLLAVPAFALTHVVDYTDTGFTPPHILIKLTDSLEIRNSTTTDLSLINTQVSANQNIALRFGTIPAQSYFISTPTHRGTYTFQNRHDPSKTITVQVTDRASLVAYYTKLHETATAALTATSGSLLNLPATLIATDSASSSSAAPQALPPEPNFPWKTFLIPLTSFLVYLSIFTIFIIKG
jgi:hypothetical protein